VDGRSILDNVLITTKIIHYHKSKSKGGRGEVALKINISKAYNIMNWRFLEVIMCKKSF